MVTLEWIEFGCVHKLYPLNRIVRQPVTETGLIVYQYTVRRRQYDRLSQQQLLRLSVDSKSLSEDVIGQAVIGLAVTGVNEAYAILLNASALLASVSILSGC